MNNPQMQQIKNLMHQMQNAPNPQAALQQLVMSNPYLSNIINLSNGNLEQAARSLASQRGIDINTLLQELQS